MFFFSLFHYYFRICFISHAFFFFFSSPTFLFLLSSFHFFLFVLLLFSKNLQLFVLIDCIFTTLRLPQINVDFSERKWKMAAINKYSFILFFHLPRVADEAVRIVVDLPSFLLAFGQCCLLVCVCECVLWLCWFFLRCRFPFYHLFSAAANFVFGRNEAAAAGPTKGATKRALGVTRSTRFYSRSLSLSPSLIDVARPFCLSFCQWHVAN